MKKIRLLFIYEGITTGGIWTSFNNLLSRISKDEEFETSVMFLNETNFDVLPEHITCFRDESLSRKELTGTRKLVELIRNGLLFNSIFCRFFRNNKQIYNPLIQKREYKESAHKKIFDARNKYDVVISFCELYTNYLLCNSVVANKKIGWIHPDYKLACFNKKIDRNAFGNLDCVVSVSNSNTKYLKNIFPNLTCKFETVYNLLDVKDIINKSSKYDVAFNNDVINFVTVARLHNISKAFDRTIKIFHRLNNKGYSNFVWRIIGDGQDKKRMQRMICKYKLSDNIKLLGKLDNPFPYVVKSDLMLLLSKYEGKPVSIEEAQVLGIPSLVTNYPSASEQIKNGHNGIIVGNSKNEIFICLEKILKKDINIHDLVGDALTTDGLGYNQFKKIIKEEVAD